MVMIPKVIVWQSDNKEELLGKLSITNDEVITLDGSSVTVEDFRFWINNSINTISSRPGYKLMVWWADSLSWECQAVLLKPLEELDDKLTFYLVVRNESMLAETIISRCFVEKYVSESENNDQGYWEKVLNCWRNGPGACVEFSETIDKEKVEVMADELIKKMQSNLITEVNEKRLGILEETLNFSRDLKTKNLNIKLLTGDFLLRTWRLIKT